MAWTAADLPDLTGRTAVITGANGGEGRYVEATKAGGRALSEARPVPTTSP